MLDRQTVLTLFEETAQVFLFNLDFIPDDKLSWKPAPDAKSVLEIINHLAEFLNSISSRLESQDAEFVPAANRSQAKQVLARSAERFASAVHGATAQALGAKFRDDMPLTLGWMATAATLDTIHHAGQIAYIQTLLGDTEIHFDQSAMPNWAVR